MKKFTENQSSLKLESMVMKSEFIIRTFNKLTWILKCVIFYHYNIISIVFLMYIVFFFQNIIDEVMQEIHGFSSIIES